jgi:hypothetical protein
MVSSPTFSLARQVERLRVSHGHAPALDVLDLVMRGHHGKPIGFGAEGVPPSEFALTVAEAFDSVMTRAEWLAWTGVGADPQARAFWLIKVWPIEAWPKFCQRYSLTA